MRDNLIKEAKRVEQDGLYSSKGHYAAADFWRKVHLRLGVPTAICTSIAGIVIIAGPASFFVELIFGLVALAGGVCTGLMVFLEPERKSTAHQTAADRYNSLKGRTRRFYNIDVNREELTIEELSERLESLTKERDELNESSPIIPEGAYEKGKKGIEAGQAAYEVDRQ